MNERTQIVVFITTFFAIYGAMHLFVLNQLSNYFSIEKTVFLYLLLVVLTISYVLATILESKYTNLLTKYTYFLTAIWLGLIFMLFIFGLVIDVLRIFINIKPLHAGIIMIGASVMVCIAGMINTLIIKINHVTIQSSKVSKDVKIVQLSDFHIGPIYTNKFLSKIIRTTNNLNPDIVVITGDLLDGKYNYPPEMFKSLGNIRAKTFFVMGNHDSYAGTMLVEDILKHYPIMVLRDKTMMCGELQIIGFDDSEDKQKVEHGLNMVVVDTNKFSILLYHRPEGFKYAANKHIDLMLAGHTHAGQIFPFNILAYLSNGYLQGLYKENNSYLYVSAGVGTWGPPIRTGSRSEIVEIIVHKTA